MLALLFLFLALPLRAADFVQPQLMYNDPRIMGMGNAYTAIADDRNIFFFNPAGFATFGMKKFSLVDAIVNPGEWKPKYRNIPDITVADVGARMNSALFETEKQKAFQTLVNLGIIPADIASLNDLLKDPYLSKIITLDPFVTNGAHYGWGNLTLSQLSNFNQAINELMNTALSVSLDTSFLTLVGHYWGLGIFEMLDTSMTFGFQGLLPDVKFTARDDLAVMAGFGMPWPGFKRLNVGITGKYFIRAYARADSYDDFLEIGLYDYSGFGTFGNIDVQRDLWKYLTSGMEITNQLPETLFFGTGVGFDLGFLYRFKHNINIGLQLSDVVSYIHAWDTKPHGHIPIDARLGVAWRPRWDIWGLFEDPLFAADVSDLFWQQPGDLWMKTHFGMEFKMLFKLIQVRLGLNQGYPTVGVGLDLSLYFLSKIPLVQWLRPDAVYFPQFNPNRKDFVRKNPCCCLVTGALSPLLYLHLKVDFLYYGRELGGYAGAVPDTQWALRASVSESF
jgi:hypothetical protein